MNRTSSSTLNQSIDKSLISFDPRSDEMLALWVPIAVYWIQCSLFEILMRLKIPFFEQYRIASPSDRDKRNKVPFIKVLWMVALQHAIQMAVGIGLMYYHTLSPVPSKPALSLHGFILSAIQFISAMFIMDTYQYTLHRLAHSNQFIYKHMHSHHHRLYVPYAFGALYNHPLEGFLLDSCGGALAFELTGMSPRLGMYFFIFSTLKTINDHCGYAFPWDPLTVCFQNNVNYHHIHHQAHGIKTNFSQPFFTFWDVLLHTEYTQVMKAKAAKKST